MKELDIRCQDCNRFLKVTIANTTICQITCPDRKCKKVNNIKVVFSNSTDEQIRYKFPVSDKA